MTKNKITSADFKLRLFIDTNVLIDYVEKFNVRKSIDFLNLFERKKTSRKSGRDNIELVTSDYVLWEFYGHYRQELYARELVAKKGYGYIQANKEAQKDNFRCVDIKSMRRFGDKINREIAAIENKGVISIQRLIGKEFQGFSEFIDKVLQSTKFSYKDAIVLVSALFTRADSIITCDEQGFHKDRIEELREAMQTCPIPKAKIIFKKPDEFSSLAKIKREYKLWFDERNSDKSIGKIIKYYPRINVIEIKCNKGCSLKEKDNIYFVQFFDNKNFVKFLVKIPRKASGNFQNPKTRKPIQKGRHISIKLPARFPHKSKGWEGGDVFLSE